jgi:hypothetical protein
MFIFKFIWENDHALLSGEILKKEQLELTYVINNLDVLKIRTKMCGIGT